MSTKLIFLDAGKSISSTNKISEWNVNNLICQLVKKYLAEYDCLIVRADRNRQDHESSLIERRVLALNNKADLYISIHTELDSDKQENIIYTTEDSNFVKDLEFAQVLCKYAHLRTKQDFTVQPTGWNVIPDPTIPSALIYGYRYTGAIIGDSIAKEFVVPYAKFITDSIINYLHLEKGTPTPLNNQYQISTTSKEVDLSASVVKVLHDTEAYFSPKNIYLGLLHKGSSFASSQTENIDGEEYIILSSGLKIHNDPRISILKLEYTADHKFNRRSKNKLIPDIDDFPVEGETNAQE